LTKVGVALEPFSPPAATPDDSVLGPAGAVALGVWLVAAACCELPAETAGAAAEAAIGLRLNMKATANIALLTATVIRGIGPWFTCTNDSPSRSGPAARAVLLIERGWGPNPLQNPNYQSVLGQSGDSCDLKLVGRD